MSNVHELPVSSTVFDEASAWIARLDNGLSTAQAEALRQWLIASPKHKEVLFEMAALWDRMEGLSRLSDICPHSVNQSNRYRWFLPAASLLIVILGGMWGTYHAYYSDSQIERPVAEVRNPVDFYETAIGEQSTIHLPDGSQLVLNTNTRVQVKFTDRYRLLKLDRGELHVVVAPDEFRPLSVIAGDRIIQAIGTAFNIEIREDHEIELVVTDGKVLIGIYEGHQPGGGHSVPVILPPSSMTVSAGEETVLTSAEYELDTIETDEIAVKLSWREGNLIFRGETLEDAVAEIGRYTAVEFVILDEESKNVRVAGMFKAGDVNGLLVALEKNFNVTNRRIGDKQILLRGR